MSIFSGYFLSTNSSLYLLKPCELLPSLSKCGKKGLLLWKCHLFIPFLPRNSCIRRSEQQLPTNFLCVAHNSQILFCSPCHLFSLRSLINYFSQRSCSKPTILAVPLSAYSGFQIEWLEYTIFAVSVHEVFVYSARYHNFYNPDSLHNYAMMCIFLHTEQRVLSVTSLQCDASFFRETSQCKWWDMQIRGFFTKMVFNATSFRKKNLKLGFKDHT